MVPLSVDFPMKFYMLFQGLLLFIMKLLKIRKDKTAYGAECGRPTLREEFYAAERKAKMMLKNMALSKVMLIPSYTLRYLAQSLPATL